MAAPTACETGWRSFLRRPAADATISMDGSKDAFDKGIDPDTGEEVEVLPEKMLTTYYTYYEKKTSKDLAIWFGYGDIAQKFTPLPDDLIYNEYPEEINFETLNIGFAASRFTADLHDFLTIE